jgi:hypothetical protein
MKTSPVLQALGRLYRESRAGRTGQAQRDFIVDFKKLLAAADSRDGDARELALSELRSLSGAWLTLEFHPRDPDIIHTVRISPAREAELFARLGETSPSQRREEIARQFEQAASSVMPERWQGAWIGYCARQAASARAGETVAPFSREDLSLNAELLGLIPRLLEWQRQGGESLIRFVSCVLCGDSKRLEQLAVEDGQGRHRGRIGAVLEDFSQGGLGALEDLGILESPRFALIYGPLRLLLDGEWLSFERLEGPFRLSSTDLLRATRIDSSATRCLTVENETSFHELAKLRSGTLLVCTSYPGAATLALLQKLPARLEFWHFGDSDPAGFDILRDLRERTGRAFQSLHMGWRPDPAGSPLSAADQQLLSKLLSHPLMVAEHQALHQMLASGTKGVFEQESLGRPDSKEWPFYCRVRKV